MMKTGICVAIIDDSRADGVLLGRRLYELPFWEIEYKIFEDPEEALLHIPTLRPDVVFIDYLLGPMTGTALIQRLLEEGCEAACVLLTGMGGERAAVEALRAGAQDYLTKDEASPESLDRVLRHVMEQRRASHALQVSENKYRQLVESTPDWVWSTDNMDCITYSNDAIEKLLGYTPDELLGRPRSSLLHPDDRSLAKQLLSELACASHGWRNQPFRFFHADGSLRQFESSGQASFDSNGRLTGCLGIDRDVTEQGLAAEALHRRLELERLAAIVSAALVKAHQEDLDHTIQFALQGAGEILQVDRVLLMLLNSKTGSVTQVHEWHISGLPPHRDIHAAQTLFDFPWALEKLSCFENIVIHDVNDLPPEASVEQEYCRKLGAQAALAVPLHSGSVLSGFFALSRTQGPMSWFLEDITMLKSIGDVVTSAAQRIRTEQELIESNRKFQIMFMESLDAILLIRSDDLTILNVNPRITDILGYMEADLLGKSFKILYPPEQKEIIPDWPEVLRVEGAVFQSLEFLRSDGLNCPMDLTATLIPWENEQVILVTLRDVSERIRAEAERTRLEEAIAQAVEAFIITDLNGVILYVNSAFERTTGYTREEVLGKTPRILKSGKHDDSFYEQMWNTLKRGETWQGRVINKRKNGTRFVEDTIISPIRDTHGRISSYAAVKQDVTQQIRLENQLRQAQKMEAIGTLAGGIAHDFNNILSPILGYTDMVMHDMPEGSPQRGYLDEVYRAGERARELVRQILTFSRQAEQKWRPVLVHTIVKEVMKLLRASIPSTITIESKVDENCGYVLGDATQIHQILMNLCTNAYQAMRETGGRLRVSLAPILLEKEEQIPGTGLKQGAYIRLAVEDTGHGIDKVILGRIFDPFFSTKRVGEGTGLGLSTVHGIVASHNGAITVHSEVGKGSTFTVYLPRLDDVEVSEANRNELIPGGMERILLVDDEAAVLDMCTQMLERLGYEVTARQSSIEALELFRRNPSAFDLVMTDQTMPGLTGDKLAVEILKILPGAPILLMTGFSDYMDETMAHKMGISEFVMKPLVLRNLSTALRRALDKNETEGNNGAPSIGHR